MPVPLHLETKWHYAILAQGAEVGEEISLPLELACYDLSFLEQDLKAMVWAEGGGDFWHQQWCLSTPLTAWAAASQVPPRDGCRAADVGFYLGLGVLMSSGLNHLVP